MSVSENTRDLLILVSKKLFASKGLEGTTVKEISDQAGVNISLVSYYFGGKEGLYKACIDAYVSMGIQVSERILKPVSSSDEFKIRLDMFVSELLTLLIREPDLAALVQRELENNSDLVAEIAPHTFLKVAGQLISFIEDAQKNQIVNTNLDPIVFSCTLFSTLMNACRMDRFHQTYFHTSIFDNTYRTHFLETVSLLFLHGALKR